jgi:threonine/homoserine/homoserine lactone efflux protein
MPLRRIFFWGCWISFLGTLPLGTLNVFAAQLAVNEGVAPAIWFSIGALLVEMYYVRLSLVAMDWVRRKRELFRALEWVTVCVIALLAIGSFRAAYHAPENGSVVVRLGFRSGAIYCLLLGAVLSAVNPLQIPFWFGWSTLLFSKNILHPSAACYNGYIAGIGMGTFAGNGVFIFGGRLLVEKLRADGNIVNWVTGGIFGVTALVLLWKMVFRRDGAGAHIQ